MSFEKLERKYVEVQRYIKTADISTPETGISSLNHIREATSELDIMAEEIISEIQKCGDNYTYKKMCIASRDTSRMFSQFREDLVDKHRTNKKVMGVFLSQ